MMRVEILIIGTGAQAKYALETFHLAGKEAIGIISLPGEKSIASLDGAPVVASLDELEDVYEKHEKPLLLFCCSKNRLKEELKTRLEKYRPAYVSAIHPTAVISRTATVGQGTIINARAVIQPFVKVGNHAMIHAGVVIEHDCVVDDYANLAPNVTLAGWTRVGKGATLYTGAIAIPTINIGEYATIGAGGVVLQNIPDNATAVGIPARLLQKG